MKLKGLYISLILMTALAACEKDITIDLPEYEPKIVVEGRIEQNLPPFVFLTNSQEFFGTSDLLAFQNSFVTGATVIVSNGAVTDTLLEICSQSLPSGLDTLVAQYLGIPLNQLQTVNICGYVSINPALIGQTGTTYDLTIKYEDDTYTSRTRIPESVALDSVWFDVQPGNNPYGFSWATLSDPVSAGNGYRWFARRLNRDSNGELKDPNFLAPFGSAFDDKFFNGLTFDFGYDRPSSEGDEGNDRGGYYKVGDTIAIKFCTIEKPIVDYLTAAETQAANAGSPFAAPANNPTNITGGALGLWAGYGVSYDTIIALP